MMRVLFILLTSICLLFPLASPVTAKETEISWTDDELQFIEKHPVIELGVDPQFVPFEFIDENGEHKGIAPDILALISEKTGLQFKVRKGLTWPEAYDLALLGELDGLPAVGKTPEREESFLLSEPYYYFKRVIVTNDQDQSISSIDDLAGKTVAVQRNSSHHSYLLQHEDIHLSLYDSVEAALVAVATNKEKAFIGNLATTNYLIRTNGLTDLRFIAFEAEKQQALYFAASKDHPELISIFNKAAATITEAEINEINSKWIELDTSLDYGPLIQIGLILAAIFILILAISIYWINRLRKEIEERKKIERSLIEANEKADRMNGKLQQANAELEKMTMVDGLTGIFNRRYLDSFLEKLWEINMQEKFPIALIMLDIDRFKQYNDTYGHLAGDECLKQIAQLIDVNLDRKSDFVARYGGEEFAILLSNTTEDGAMRVAEKIRFAIEQTEIDNGIEVTSITVSLGVSSMISTRLMSASQLIKTADYALYEAKEAGRNRVVKASSMKVVDLVARR